MRQLAILPIFTLVLAACIASNLPADDIDIARQLSNRLRVAKAEGNLKGFRINVKVEDSVVWLSGNVPNDSQQQIALQHAQEIPGVRLVVNNISVGDAVPFADAGLAELDGNFVAPIVSGSQYDEALITAPKLASATQRSTGLVDRVAATSAQPGGGGNVHVAGLNYPPTDFAIPPSHVTATPPFMLVPNVGYVGLVPTSVGAAQAPPMVPVVPAVVPAPQVAGARPVPISAARPARLVNYQCDASGCYGGGSPMGTPVSECAGGFCPGGPGFAGGGFDGGYPMAAGGNFPMGPGGHFGGGYGPGMYGAGMSGARYENPQMPGYAWPSYASHPNYAAVTYPRQYSPMAWPYIGPFYPYPQVPLGWRKVCLEWDDGWWMLDFKAKSK